MTRIRLVSRIVLQVAAILVAIASLFGIALYSADWRDYRFGTEVAGWRYLDARWYVSTAFGEFSLACIAFWLVTRRATNGALLLASLLLLVSVCSMVLL